MTTALDYIHANIQQPGAVPFGPAHPDLVIAFQLPGTIDVSALHKCVELAQSLGATGYVFDVYTRAADGLIEVECYRSPPPPTT